MRVARMVRGSTAKPMNTPVAALIVHVGDPLLSQINPVERARVSVLDRSLRSAMSRTRGHAGQAPGGGVEDTTVTSNVVVT